MKYFVNLQPNGISNKQVKSNIVSWYYTVHRVNPQVSFYIYKAPVSSPVVDSMLIVGKRERGFCIVQFRTSNFRGRRLNQLIILKFIVSFIYVLLLV